MPRCGCPKNPARDVAVFSAMAHVILKEKLYNQEFIDERTENFADFAASMEKFTPEYAETISGVDRELIVQAARLYAGAQKRRHLLGAGHPRKLARHRQRPQPDQPGPAHRAHRAAGHRAQPAARAEQRAGRLGFGAMPWHYPGYQRVDNEDRRAKSLKQAWNIEPGGLNRKPGLTTTEILSSVGSPGGVRSLYIMGENPMMSEPNLNLTRQHMEQLEFVVAQDLFINETGALPMSSCRPPPGPKKTAPSPTPTGACSACARPCPPADRPAPIGRSSAIWPSASKSAWGARQRRLGLRASLRSAGGDGPRLVPEYAGVQLCAHRERRAANPGLG